MPVQVNVVFASELTATLASEEAPEGAYPPTYAVGWGVMCQGREGGVGGFH